MIHVDRPGDPGSIPKSLSGAGSAAEKERERMAKHFEEKGTLDGFAFAVYKNPDVKAALEGLFHNKCAYCEVPLSRQPIDVEHFRPKGGYFDGPDFELKKPGYFWLAAEWTNLLPSCIDCNRGRKQKLVGGETRLVGKENHFPLGDPARRAKKAGDEVHEAAILLDPCVDQPEKHLEFPELGEGVVRPALRADGTEDPRGRETIDILGLDAVNLIGDRKLWWKEIWKHIKFVTTTVKHVREAPDAATRAERLQELEELKKELEEYQQPDRPYAGMARQIISKVRVDWP